MIEPTLDMPILFAESIRSVRVAAPLPRVAAPLLAIAFAALALRCFVAARVPVAIEAAAVRAADPNSGALPASPAFVASFRGPATQSMAAGHAHAIIEVVDRKGRRAHVNSHVVDVRGDDALLEPDDPRVDLTDARPLAARLEVGDAPLWAVLFAHRAQAKHDE